MIGLLHLVLLAGGGGRLRPRLGSRDQGALAGWGTGLSARSGGSLGVRAQECGLKIGLEEKG